MVSDFHGDIKAFQGASFQAEDDHADIVVVCGDITHFGSLCEAKNLLSTLVRLRVPVYFVPGNCDPASMTGVDFEGVRCIHGVCQIHEDLMFIGVGGSLISPFQTNFELSEKEIEEVLNQGFKQVQSRRWLILVSHNPPNDTKVDVTYSGEHIGSISLRRFIEDKKPSIVFCGHVHESRGIDHICDTIIMNPGSAKDGYYALADFNENDGSITTSLLFMN